MQEKDKVSDLLKELNQNKDKDMDTAMIAYRINALYKNINHLKIAKEESEKKVFSNILKEGGNKLWNYFIYMAIPNHEEIPCQYKDVNTLRNSNPKLYSQWNMLWMMK